jgi:hypothetical protein
MGFINPFAASNPNLTSYYEHPEKDTLPVESADVIQVRRELDSLDDLVAVEYFLEKQHDHPTQK